MSLQGKDRTLHEREEELFRIKQKIFFQKPDENNNMYYDNINFQVLIGKKPNELEY